jgi:hypothetical protein
VRAAYLYLTQPYGEEWLTELDGLTVGDETFDDFAGDIRLDFVHQLHRFDNADYLPFFDAVAGSDKGSRAWRR